MGCREGRIQVVNGGADANDAGHEDDGSSSESSSSSSSEESKEPDDPEVGWDVPVQVLLIHYKALDFASLNLIRTVGCTDGWTLIFDSGGRRRRCG